MFDSPNARITRKYGWYQPEHVHELEYQQAYVLSLLAGFSVEEEKGIIPEELIRPVGLPEVVNGWSSVGDFNRIEMDDTRAFSSDLENSFIYWICAKKTGIADEEKLLSVNTVFHRWNKKPKYFCSNTGTLADVGDGKAWILSEDRGAVLFGPYQDYPAGKYTCKFSLLSIPGHAYDGTPLICILDVVAGADCRKICEIPVHGKVFKGKRKLSFNVAFELFTTENLQFRVISASCEPFYVDVDVPVKRF
ncbi:hypothetical protein [uncultured Selenomonas sp.]|uniref:hypothetical protein n=1 Tax=uncultured Selenomonas sp. TaxID=159275 RepID=UPI0025F1C039|nr:hypothetical protein [uncultured Selenomonas sp.]